MSANSVSRRKFLEMSVASGSAALLGSYGALIEPNELSVERVNLLLPRWPRALSGLTIAQLSDIHFGPYLGEDELGKVVKATMELEPDLVVLTGDFVSIPLLKSHGRPQRRAEDAGPCSKLLAGLHPKMGIAAVLGNHDHLTNPVTVAKCLENNDIPVLRNRSIPIERGSARFWLAGVDDVMAQADDLARTLRAVPPDEPAIVLVHEPDFAETVAHFQVDLQLSGHSHGGQVRIPILGPPVLPFMGSKFPLGLRRLGHMHLYTNRGVGTTSVPIRFNCTPEITLITLNAIEPLS
jgi:predicted MPP superfamily phosphohydrolase